MLILNYLREKLSEISPAFKYKKISYSQYGEDIIVMALFNEYAKIQKPSYLDLGAHHPYALSNTALMHKLGSRGVNVEADPILIKEFIKYRKDDINLNIGISVNTHTTLPFYVMKGTHLNTFVKETAEELNDRGYLIDKIIDVKCFNLDFIIKKYCNNVFPDFLTIDIEGMDEAIIGSYDFRKSSPKIICIETLNYGFGIKIKKRTGIRETLVANNYTLVADTFLNEIFVRSDLINY